MALIKSKKSIIVACDVEDLNILKKLVKDTCSVKGIGAYKIGFELALKFGIPNVVKEIRKLTKLPIIYDHQKAATDIPDTAEKFMKAVKGVDSVILFPMSGPNVEEAWINAAQKAKLHVIVGGEMTHPGYLKEDGGFIASEAPKRIYQIASSHGVTDFVVPGNKPDKIKMYREFLESRGIKPIFYSPGFIAQGGKLGEGAEAAGDNFHAIVGRAIYDSKNIKEAAEKLVKEICG